MFPDALNHNSNSTPFFQISFNEVKFNYPARKDVPILRGWFYFAQARDLDIITFSNFPVSMVINVLPRLSLDVAPGTTVALVGPPHSKLWISSVTFWLKISSLQRKIIYNIIISYLRRERYILLILLCFTLQLAFVLFLFIILCNIWDLNTSENGLLCYNCLCTGWALRLWKVHLYPTRPEALWSGLRHGLYHPLLSDTVHNHPIWNTLGPSWCSGAPWREQSEISECWVAEG